MPRSRLGVIAEFGLLLVWLVRVWARGHRHAGERDPRLTAARERRCF
jgi:hypothetical protein